MPLEAASLGSALAAEVRRARRTATEVAVHIAELDSGRTIYEWEADRGMIVASNVKLVTTAAALEELGPDYILETQALLRGRLIDGVLHGDVAVIGSGDATISGRFFEGDPMAVLRQWARRLKELGVRALDGDLYLVHGFFDDELVHRDWPQDQLARWYEAPVDALSFSDNCILVRIVPGARRGSRAMVQVVPDLDFVHVEGTVVTTDSVRRHHVMVDREPGSDTIRIAGQILRSAPPVETWVTIDDPARYFGSALVKALEIEGIRGVRHIRSVETLPSGPWRTAITYRSDLLTMIEVTNRRSQNYFAESLLKGLGARRCDSGSWRGGLEVLAEFLRRVGVDAGYRLVDGSGMSRNNVFSARHLTRLLTYMSAHRWSREFLGSLPYSGYEDHPRWRTRLAEAPYRGNVVAKTGSLRGVSTISGYANGVSGTTYVFSVLCNGAGSIRDARRAQDRILRALIDHG